MIPDTITLSHGSGGRLMHELIEELFVTHFSNPELNNLNDSAIVDVTSKGNKVAFTTDSFVVQPIFFPGGDIGKLALCGTINDLSVDGALPLYIAVSFILEEGLPMSTLQRIVVSMAETAKKADVKIVTGDTKVVDKGSCDKLFITTTGIGVFKNDNVPLPDRVKPGDKIIISGYIGDHGIAVLSKREGLQFETSLKSDCAPLNALTRKMLDASSNIKWMRDPTRGGIAASLNEVVAGKSFGAVIKESSVPTRDSVRGACEMLGLDPMYVANEGKIVAVVDSDDADKVLNAMRKDEAGVNASVAGEIVEGPEGLVLIETDIGGKRILDMPRGELLPRIC